MSTDLAMTIWAIGTFLLLMVGWFLLMDITISPRDKKFPRWWFWLAGIWIAPVALHAWFIVVWLFLKVG